FGGLTLGPAIDPQDGRLNLVIASTTNAFTALSVLWRMLARRFRGAADLHYASVRSVRIDSQPSLPVHVDGEPFGRTPLAAEVAPGCVRLVVPDGTRTRAT